MTFSSIVDSYASGVTLARSPSPYGHHAYNEHVRYNASQYYSQFVDSPIMFNKVDRSNWLYQPNLVRWRSRYRGVRESLKVNQEIGQYYYDINVLNLRQQSVNNFLATIATDIQSGATFQLIKYNWATDSISADTSISILGLDTMACRIETLKQRLRTLES